MNQSESGKTPLSGADENLSGFGMTELEEQLAGENGRKIQEEIAQRLRDRGTELQKKMDEGLEPSVYQTYEKVYRSLAAAHEIVVSFPVATNVNKN
jgi:hypothetical protein